MDDTVTINRQVLVNLIHRAIQGLDINRAVPSELMMNDLVEGAEALGIALNFSEEQSLEGVERKSARIFFPDELHEAFPPYGELPMGEVITAKYRDYELANIVGRITSLVNLPSVYNKYALGYMTKDLPENGRPEIISCVQATIDVLWGESGSSAAIHHSFSKDLARHGLALVGLVAYEHASRVKLKPKFTYIERNKE